MSMWQDGLLFADAFLYVKLMTEKSEKKMLCCKICLLCSLHRKILFSQYCIFIHSVLIMRLSIFIQIHGFETAISIHSKS